MYTRHVSQQRDRITPAQIHQAGSRELSIRWADGAESLYDVRDLLRAVQELETRQRNAGGRVTQRLDGGDQRFQLVAG